jgi:Uma2 family endonuclease
MNTADLTNVANRARVKGFLSGVAIRNGLGKRYGDMNNTAKTLRVYTWDDYQTWPDDRRWEIIRGEAHTMSPSPTARHQIIQTKLARRLDEFFDGAPCRVIVSPMDVKLSEMDVVQPDVLVVCKPKQIKRTHIEGGPALVVEILSESSALLDRTTKMQVYARYGIPEVWLVTPYPSMVEVYRLDGEGYRLAGTYTRAETLKSPGFPKLKLQLKNVFDFPLEPGEKAGMVVRETPPPYGSQNRASER